MMRRVALWIKWFPINCKMYRLNYWVWKNKVINGLLGPRCNRVTEPLSEWELIDEGLPTPLRYRAVGIINGRKRWPFKRAYRTGFQLVSSDATPLIASTIDEVVALRKRIRGIHEKHERRRMQKEAFGIK